MSHNFLFINFLAQWRHILSRVISSRWWNDWFWLTFLIGFSLRLQVSLTFFKDSQLSSLFCHSYRLLSFIMIILAFIIAIIFIVTSSSLSLSIYPYHHHDRYHHYLRHHFYYRYNCYHHYLYYHCSYYSTSFIF